MKLLTEELCNDYKEGLKSVIEDFLKEPSVRIALFVIVAIYECVCVVYSHLEQYTKASDKSAKKMLQNEDLIKDMCKARNSIAHRIKPVNKLISDGLLDLL